MLRANQLLIALAAFAVVSSARAQWPDYPTPDVPRTADGEVDLDGPTPRTPDGHPDFTGLWSGRSPFAEQKNDDGGPPLASFKYIGANLDGGLPFQPWAKKLYEERVAAGSGDNPEAACLPMGNMQFHTQGAPRKFVQTPRLLVILYEASMGIRQIFIDGRPSPDNDPQPWFYGYSTGHWEGDDLVVTTTNLRDGEWLDIDGSPLTSAATVTEKFRRPTFGSMQIDITVDDPKAYTEPWTVRVNQSIMLDQELIEFVCLENQRYGQ
jgi:hypothetical protein